MAPPRRRRSSDTDSGGTGIRGSPTTSLLNSGSTDTGRSGGSHTGRSGVLTTIGTRRILYVAPARRRKTAGFFGFCHGLCWSVGCSDWFWGGSACALGPNTSHRGWCWGRERRPRFFSSFRSFRSLRPRIRVLPLRIPVRGLVFPSVQESFLREGSKVR